MAIMHSRGVLCWLLLIIGCSMPNTRVNCFHPPTFASSSFRLYLNRIFVEPYEVKSHASDNFLTVTFESDDYRYKHISKVLKMDPGDEIKLGVVGMGMTDHGKLLCKTGNNMTLSLCMDSFDSLTTRREPPNVDLLLACPRPLRLERMLPTIACQGVNSLVLLDAAKVEKDFFGSHLFRRPEAVRAAFVEGLSQASCDYILPEMRVRRRLQQFLEEIDAMFPAPLYLRVIAHPPKILDGSIRNNRLSELSRTHSNQRLVIAVGPEGGWTEEEVLAFISKGFLQISLGDRILRTDVAVSVLLGLAREWTEKSPNLS